MLTVRSSSRTTSAPSSSSMRSAIVTSEIIGRFSKIQRSAVRIVAKITATAAFFIPAHGILPCSGRPPLIRIVSIFASIPFCDSTTVASSVVMLCHNEKMCECRKQTKKEAQASFCFFGDLFRFFRSFGSSPFSANCKSLRSRRLPNARRRARDSF